MLLQARAQGLLGHDQEAIQQAQSSYAIFPSVEAAREAARWLSAAGQDAEALQALAEAFSIAGLRSADSEGGSDRTRMSELYRKLHGSEAGLGDLILKTYDSTSAQLSARRAELRQFDPNAQIKDPSAIHPVGPGGRQIATFVAARQSNCDRLLGHLVHAVPRTASALRSGEGEI